MSEDLWLINEELKQLKTEKESLDAEASGLGQRSGSASLVVSSRVSGHSLPKGVKAEPSAPKKKCKHKPKRHTGLPLEDRKEYCKSYLTHI